MARDKEISTENLQRIEAALSGTDRRDELQQRLQELMLKDLERKNRQLEQDEEHTRVRRENLAKEMAARQAQRLAMQKSCTHRRSDGSVRTGGQFLSDGRLRIACLWCGYEMYDPPKEGENPTRQDLMPQGDFVGSAAGMFR